ncbi:hypothetical protein DMUE_0631 [Dictyocoela muelleri]|nr:hypothetical protein DMUE_0631 [Dictyocoela muelleri]
MEKYRLTKANNSIYEDIFFRESVELITELALVPVEEIERCWNYILQSRTVFTNECNQFFTYVHNNLITINRPLFNPAIWIRFGVFRHRTNNAAEGFHSIINRSVNKSNPNFYEIVYKIIEIQEDNDIELL